MKTLILILSLILLSANIAFADKSITFGWDANNEPDLKGYRIYEKAADNNYVLIEDVVYTVTSHTIIVPDIIEKTWVFTAYDMSNNESGYSNEVSSDTKPPGTPTFRITVIVDVVNP